VRLELDVALVFSANPEDYTARGKIVTPLKDRIGSEIRTHYPETLEEGMAITAQESWSARGFLPTEVPSFIREIVEQIAFAARVEKKVDKRSGVSQRLPISTMELVISNAERRALSHEEEIAVPRVGDIFAALPGITGKVELEYEGEMRGADNVIRDLVSSAVATIFDKYFADTNTQQIEQWFNLGGTVKIDDTEPAAGSLASLRDIQGLMDKLSPLNVNMKDAPEVIVAAAEFLLEGMVAHRRISRNEERLFSAPERARNRAERNVAMERERRDPELDDWAAKKSRRGFN
jgi:magnesium chelatase subunit I